MGNLDNSWNLETRLKEVECPTDLRVQIDKFIKRHHDKCTGKKMSVNNLTYRCSLHYIEDNLRNPGLLNEITNVNNS